jgi:hypothetical protein
MNDRISYGRRSDRVLQAQGMVSVQAACSVDDALAWMAERAAESGMSLDALASAIIEHRIRFTTV